MMMALPQLFPWRSAHGSLQRIVVLRQHRLPGQQG